MCGIVSYKGVGHNHHYLPVLLLYGRIICGGFSLVNHSNLYLIWGYINWNNFKVSNVKMNSNQKRIILIEMILIGFLLITYITGTIQFEIVVIVTVIYLICFLGWFYFKNN